MSRDDEKHPPRYRPSWNTDIMATLKKHGFKPTSAQERARKSKFASPPTENVRYLASKRG